MKTLLPLLILLTACPVEGNTLNYIVTMNTASLVGSGKGPFSLDFQFNDGSSLNDGNNTVTLTNFAGVAPVGSPNTSGGASGSLASTVTLTDSSFFNELFQQFTAAPSLSFRLSFTTNVDAGGTPDSFTLAILNGALNELPTHDPSGANTFITINLSSASPTIQTYAGDGQAVGGFPIPAPNVTPAGAVPEPASVMTMAFGLVTLGLLFARSGFLGPPCTRARTSTGRMALGIAMNETGAARTFGPVQFGSV